MRGARRRLSLAALALVLALGVTLPPGAHAGPAAGNDAPTRDLDVERLLRLQNARLDSLLDPLSTRIDTTGIGGLADSLDLGGYDRARDLHPGSFGPPHLGFQLDPLALTAYNRVEGWRIGLGATVKYGRRLRLATAGAWAAESHRWGGRGEFRIGRPRRGLALDLTYSDLVVPFGPDARTPSSVALSWIAGQDRQDFLRRREAGARVHLVRDQGGSLSLGGFHREDHSEMARTDYSLFQGHGRPIEADNPPVDELTWSGVEVAGRWRPRGDLFEFSGRAGVSGGDVEFPWLSGSVVLRPVFPDGGILSLGLEGEIVGDDAPIQARPYLGGDDNLRGYERLRFDGQSRVSARVEYELGLDLLERAGIPYLADAHLQFIPFFDVGTTLGENNQINLNGTGDTGASEFLDGDWRSSVGLGIRRDLWFPGMESMRLDIVHRNDGAEGPWSFWFRFVKLMGDSEER